MPASSTSTTMLVGSLKKIAARLQYSTKLRLTSVEIERLQRSIDTLLNAQTALMELLIDCEEGVENCQAWEVARDTYLLTDFGGGVFAYTLKTEKNRKTATHRLCANCFNEQRKSVLKSDGRSLFRQEIYKCTSCGTVFHMGLPHSPRPPSRASCG